MIRILVRDIRIPYTAPIDEALSRAVKKVCSAFPKSKRPTVGESALFKVSVDARKRSDILRVCTCLVSVRCTEEEARTACSRQSGLSILTEEPLPIPQGNKKMEKRPLIVGFGPAGMFCALLLAERGFCPIIVERGDDIEARAEAVRRFYQTKILDTDSNIQFGAGGAGTFSDGKLMTRISDPKCTWVLNMFVRFGAPADILVQAKPHIGTDVLLKVVANIRDYLKTLGCEFYFRETMQRICTSTTPSGEVHAEAIGTANGEIPCGALILALGHSARDTYRMLYNRGFLLQPKPFSVGVRIEHTQASMNIAAYGDAAQYTAACGARGKEILLPPAEYAVSYRENKQQADGRGVYSFCMCPGGEVMAAASEEGGVVVNGMSRSARDAVNANAALAVSVRCEDYGNTPMGAIEYQRALEQRAYVAGGGDYRAPAQTVGDFLDGRSGSAYASVKPSYMEGFVCMTDLRGVLPGFVSALLADGIRHFDKQLPGFAARDAILTGVETRTSAPVRILRDDLYLARGSDNIYPIGEGAGYAGGITSAAVDGLNAALRILSVYCP